MGSQKRQQTRKATQQQAGQEAPNSPQAFTSGSSSRTTQDGQDDRPASQQNAAAPAQQSRPGEDIETARVPAEDAFDVDNRGQR